jgi:exoribonuclease-2
VFDARRLVGIEQQVRNRARQLIEDSDRHQHLHRPSGTPRALAAPVVRSPERWLRRRGGGQWRNLAGQPRLALEAFSARRHGRPAAFPICRW